MPGKELSDFETHSSQLLHIDFRLKCSLAGGNDLAWRFYRASIASRGKNVGQNICPVATYWQFYIQVCFSATIVHRSSCWLSFSMTAWLASGYGYDCAAAKHLPGKLQFISSEMWASDVHTCIWLTITSRSSQRNMTLCHRVYTQDDRQ